MGSTATTQEHWSVHTAPQKSRGVKHISLGCCLGAAVKTCGDAVKHRFSGAQTPSNWTESQTLCHHTQEQRVKHSSMGCTAITTRAHNRHTTRGTGQVFRCTTNWAPPPHKNTVYGKITPPIYYSVKSSHVRRPMSQVHTCDRTGVTGETFLVICDDCSVSCGHL